jgi:hypothetical protein
MELGLESTGPSRAMPGHGFDRHPDSGPARSPRRLGAGVLVLEVIRPDWQRRRRRESSLAASFLE